MNCLECSRLDLKQFPAHAKVGIGKCNMVSLPGVFVSFSRHRDCQSMRPADEEIVQARIDWWEKRKGK